MSNYKLVLPLVLLSIFPLPVRSQTQSERRQIKEIETELEHYYDENGCRANVDGILNPEVWFNTPPDGERILFLNKEAFAFEEKDYREGRNLIDDRKEEKFSQMEEGRPTYRVMIAIACMCCCDDDWKNVIEGLKTNEQDNYWQKFFDHSAIVNIKKQMKLAVGRDVYSDDNIIREHAQRNESLIIRQINTYKPTIIIGGNTIQYFIKNGNIMGRPILEMRDLYGDGKRFCYYTSDILFIDAYHPSSRGSYEKKIGKIKDAFDYWKTMKE